MKKVIQPATLRNPPRGYSQALLLSQSSRLLFISGQTAVDDRGEASGKGDIEAQTRRVLHNLEAIVVAAGGSLRDIVKLTTYVTDAQYLKGMYSVRKLYFGEELPTSATVIVKGLAREEFLVEMEAIALLPDS